MAILCPSLRCTTTALSTWRTARHTGYTLKSIMNSSPPPPSFTLPPLRSSGHLPVTPSPTPSPGEEDEFSLVSPRRSVPGKEKGVDGEEGDQTGSYGRVSMYVELFEEMIRTVLEHEAYLFSPREIWVLNHILALPYGPKYLLTRLLLRQPGKVHSYTSITQSYSSELGEEGVKQAALKLTRHLPLPNEVKVADRAFRRSVSPPPPLQPTKSYPVLQSTPRPRLRRKPWSDLPTGLTPEEEKADPDLAEAIRESLWASKVDRVELDDEGKVVKATNGSPKTSVSIPTSRSPSFSSIPQEKCDLNTVEGEPIAGLAKTHNAMTMDQLMTCVSADDLRKLARLRKVPLSGLANRETIIKSLNDIAQKQTTLGFTPVGKGKGKAGAQATLPFGSRRESATTSESLLVGALLPLVGGGAIQLTPELHTLVARVNLIFTRTPPLTATSSSLMLPSILVQSHKRRYPDYGPPTRSKIWTDRQNLLTWERAVYWETAVGDALGDAWLQQKRNPVPGFGIKREAMSRVDGAKAVRTIWEGLWPIWKDMVAGEGGKEVDVRKEEGGLVGDKFKTGHVLTRIMYKSAGALGVLHEHDLECEVLRALLAQRRWRRGKRGAWYDRLALVLMNHYNASPEEKEEKLREATQVCIDGLLDEDTHLIYRPALSKRLTRLEKKLDLPSDERHISFAELAKSSTREVDAPRVPDNLGKPKFTRQSSDSRDREGSLGADVDSPERRVPQQTGKSVWVGRDSEVTVEGWVLEWWEAKGYKGHHSESTIITTLFGLLMWPVLFHPLPGAFETPYQTAPLDLGEDTFAPARREIFEKRLEEMESTRTALEMLRETDARERQRGTWVVGVNWEFEREDLEELVQCIGGRALSGICRMLGEEYRHRISGVPDLIVWDFSKREARFVEVKGPNDQLSETQRIWIDVLLSSGVPVEVCRVNAMNREKSAKALEQLKKRMAGADAKAATEARKARYIAASQSGDWSGQEEEDDGEGEDEWKYESGDEGKAEGRWAKPDEGEVRASKRSRR